MLNESTTFLLVAMQTLNDVFSERYLLGISPSLLVLIFLLPGFDLLNYDLPVMFSLQEVSRSIEVGQS